MAFIPSKQSSNIPSNSKQIEDDFKKMNRSSFFRTLTSDTKKQEKYAIHDGLSFVPISLQKHAEMAYIRKNRPTLYMFVDGKYRVYQPGM